MEGSYHTETEGLKKMVNCLEDEWGFVIGTLVTDRQRQIGKWVVENYQHICHLYDIWHVAKCEYNKLQSYFSRYRPLYKILIMSFYSKLSSCCKGADGNLPTKGLSGSGGVAAKCQQPSLLGSDFNCIRGGSSNSGQVKVHRKTHPEPSLGPWWQISKVCSYEATREISQEEMDQTRYDSVNYKLKRLIKTCFLIDLHYNLLANLVERSQAYGTCGALHNEGFDQVILCLSKLYLISLSLGSLATAKLEQLVNNKPRARTLPNCQGSTRPSWSRPPIAWWTISPQRCTATRLQAWCVGK